MSQRPDLSSDVFKNYRRAVIERASGNWDSIVPRVATNLADAVAARGRPVPCPSHGGKDGFRIYHRDFAERGGGVCNTCGHFSNGLDLIQWANQWTYWTAITEIGRAVGVEWNPGDPSKAPPPPPPKTDHVPKEDPHEAPAKVKWRRDQLNTTKKGAFPVDWTNKNDRIVRYFMHRGIGQVLKHPPQDILFHPNLEYFATAKSLGGKPDDPSVRLGSFPTMLAIVRNPQGKPVNIHRTYLDPKGDGKLEGLPKPLSNKKMMSSVHIDDMRGGAIRLYPGAKQTIFTEGIETGIGARLYVMLKERILLPVWACYSEAMLGNVVPADCTEEVLAYVDNDEVNSTRHQDGLGTGQRAGVKLASRYNTERVVKIFLPPKVDEDWEDEYKHLRRQQVALHARVEANKQPTALVSPPAAASSTESTPNASAPTREEDRTRSQAAVRAPAPKTASPPSTTASAPPRPAQRPQPIEPAAESRSDKEAHRPGPTQSKYEPDGIDAALMRALQCYGDVEVGSRVAGKPHVRLRAPGVAVSAESGEDEDGPVMA